MYKYIYTYNAIIQSNSKNCKWFPMSLTLQKYCDDLSIACLKTGPLNPRQARPQNIAWFRLPWPHKPHSTSQLRHSLRKISHLITPGVSKIEIYWDHMQAKKLKFNPTKRRMLCVCVYIYIYIYIGRYIHGYTRRGYLLTTTTTSAWSPPDRDQELQHAEALIFHLGTQHDTNTTQTQYDTIVLECFGGASHRFAAQFSAPWVVSKVAMGFAMATPLVYRCGWRGSEPECCRCMVISHHWNHVLRI